MCANVAYAGWSRILHDKFLVVDAPCPDRKLQLRRILQQEQWERPGRLERPATGSHVSAALGIPIQRVKS